MAAESKLEQDLRDYAENKGCLFWKFVSPGNRGVPDRLLLGPQGQVVFMELKAPSGKLSPGQAKHIITLRDMFHRVAVVNSLDYGKTIVDSITRELQE